jgi:hypothetical protein
MTLTRAVTGDKHRVGGTRRTAAVSRVRSSQAVIWLRRGRIFRSAGTRDKTTGEPVTTFKRSTRLYNTAMKWNRGLDRDKDGIACEKK